MRSWIGSSVSFGVVVTIVQERSHVSSGVRQPAQSTETMYSMSSIRIVREHPHPPAKVWRAVTDPARRVLPLKNAANLEPRNANYWRALAEAQDGAKLFTDATKSWGEAERASETQSEKERIHQARLATEQERVAQSLAEKAEARRKADQEIQDLKNRALADIRAYIGNGI